MSASDLQIQGAWNPYPLREEWPMTPDSVFMFRRLANAPVEATAEGAHGRLLEVAAAEGTHASRLSKLGLAAFIVEPSTLMLEGARRLMAQTGTHVTLVRGIAE